MNRAGLDALRAELGLGLCPAERFRPDSLRAADAGLADIAKIGNLPT